MTVRYVDVRALVEVLEVVLTERRGCSVTVTPETSLEDLALGSLEVVDVFVALEETTGCVVSFDDVRRIEFVSEFATVPCQDVSAPLPRSG